MTETVQLSMGMIVLSLGLGYWLSHLWGRRKLSSLTKRRDDLLCRAAEQSKLIEIQNARQREREATTNHGGPGILPSPNHVCPLIGKLR